MSICSQGVKIGSNKWGLLGAGRGAGGVRVRMVNSIIVAEQESN